MKLLAVLGIVYSVFAVASPAFASSQRDSVFTRRGSPSSTSQTQHCSETTEKDNTPLDAKRNIEFLDSKVACHDHTGHIRSSNPDWESHSRDKDETSRPRIFSNQQNKS